MALSERVLAVIAEVTPTELAEARRWCEIGDRVHLLSDLTEGRERTPRRREGTGKRPMKPPKGTSPRE
ncbi:MAG: hypothetical protein OXF11_15370 [Deltaproteobacteria bacterium]|nr:hypothetical protein [Deltaproteobacteria bacterium]